MRRLPHFCQLGFPLVPDRCDGDAGSDNDECEQCGHYNDGDGESAEAGIADSRLCVIVGEKVGIGPDAANVDVASHVVHRDGNLPLAAGGRVKVVVGEVRPDDEVVVPKKCLVLIKSALDFGGFSQAPDSGGSVLFAISNDSAIYSLALVHTSPWLWHFRSYVV